MSTTINVTLREKKNQGDSVGWEGTVSVPGLKPTKLLRKDGTSVFSTTNALKTVARNLGKRLDCSVEYTEPLKKVAKKTLKVKKATKNS